MTQSITTPFCHHSWLICFCLITVAHPHCWNRSRTLHPQNVRPVSYYNQIDCTPPCLKSETYSILDCNLPKIIITRQILFSQTVAWLPQGPEKAATLTQDAVVASAWRRHGLRRQQFLKQPACDAPAADSSGPHCHREVAKEVDADDRRAKLSSPQVGILH